jgi:hypothetical protein
VLAEVPAGTVKTLADVRAGSVELPRHRIRRLPFQVTQLEHGALVDAEPAQRSVDVPGKLRALDDLVGGRAAMGKLVRLLPAPPYRAAAARGGPS